MTRSHHERTIRDLYGLNESEFAEALLLNVIRSIGFRALTDDAVKALALLHSEEERRLAMRPRRHLP